VRPSSLVTSILRWTWYPTLLAVVFVLEPYANVDLPAVAGGRALVIAIVLGLLLTLLGRAVLGRDRGAAAAALGVMGLAVATTPERAFLVLGAVVLIAVEMLLSARGRLSISVPWPRISQALNIVLVVMLLLQLGRAVSYQAGRPAVPAATAASAAAASASRPDIYVVLLDGHGRADVMARDYGYDMSSFESALEGLGFSVAGQSRANHVLTRFSLAVLFNGRPLSELGQDLNAPADERLAYAALESNSAEAMLRGAGYETIVVGSGFEHLALRGADRYIDVGPRNELEESLIASTAVGGVIDQATGGLVAAMRDRTLGEVDQLAALVREVSSTPRFVFIHLPTPHWPIALNADCSLRPTDGYSLGAIARDNHKGDATAVRLLADQTRCVDSLVVPVVRDLVERDPNAVVILFSDHGPEELLDWREPDEPGLGDRFANLFLARTPGQADLFPDDVTLVNVMPILLNAYLGTDLPLHPDDLFYGPTQALDHFVPYFPPSS
jgi:Sulfatase